MRKILPRPGNGILPAPVRPEGLQQFPFLFRGGFLHKPVRGTTSPAAHGGMPQGTAIGKGLVFTLDSLSHPVQHRFPLFSCGCFGQGPQQFGQFTRNAVICRHTVLDAVHRFPCIGPVFAVDLPQNIFHIGIAAQQFLYVAIQSTACLYRVLVRMELHHPAYRTLHDLIIHQQGVEDIQNGLPVMGQRIHRLDGMIDPVQHSLVFIIVVVQQLVHIHGLPDDLMIVSNIMVKAF